MPMFVDKFEEALTDFSIGHLTHFDIGQHKYQDILRKYLEQNLENITGLNPMMQKQSQKCYTQAKLNNLVMTLRFKNEMYLDVQSRIVISRMCGVEIFLKCLPIPNFRKCLKFEYY